MSRALRRACSRLSRQAQLSGQQRSVICNDGVLGAALATGNACPEAGSNWFRTGQSRSEVISRHIYMALSRTAGLCTSILWPVKEEALLRLTPIHTENTSLHLTARSPAGAAVFTFEVPAGAVGVLLAAGGLQLALAEEEQVRSNGTEPESLSGFMAGSHVHCCALTVCASSRGGTHSNQANAKRRPYRQRTHCTVAHIHRSGTQVCHRGQLPDL